MPDNDLLIIKWLLTTSPVSASANFDSVVHWKQQHDQTLLSWPEPVDRAIAGGFLANCPAFAFAAGYWAALHRLLPDLPSTPVPALCISEKHGAHPAGIQCQLEKKGAKWLLDGKKHFVTCGREAELLLVAASTGVDSDGKNQLRLVQVGAQQAGITFLQLDKPLAILPEISHCQIEFTKVRLSPDQILPGDGYQAYIKPFRTIEDLHVMAAILGYIMRIGTLYDWPQPSKEQLFSQLLTIRAISLADYAAPETHIATGGAFASLQTYLQNLETCWRLVDKSIHSAWLRDQAVLNIAADACARRLSAAWQQFT